MKPYKIFSLAMIVLLFFALVSSGKFNFSTNSIYYVILETTFTFVFPAFIFFSFWLISYKRKEEDKGLLNYYLKILLNFVIPYFICMIPYIIYKYGINNLKFSDFLKLLIDGNIVIQFTYVKTLIGLLICYPAAEYFIKKNTKVTLIVSLALSAIFNLFSLNTYIYTDIFNYLIYMTLGTSFSFYKKEIIKFFRKKNYRIYSDLMWAIVLTFITKINIYSFLNPVVKIFYNISMILLITYFLYRIQGDFYRDRKYLFNKLIFNPPIVGISIFLLLEITLEFVGFITNTYILTIPGVFVYLAGIMFIIYSHIFEKTNELIEERHIERKKQRKN